MISENSLQNKMQKGSGPENPKWAAPHVTHANTGTPLAALARG